MSEIINSSISIGLEDNNQTNPLKNCDCLFNSCPNCGNGIHINDLVDKNKDEDDFYPELNDTEEGGMGGATREFTLMMLFVIGLLIGGIYLIWTISMPLYIRIIISGIIVLSLYYQIMIFRLQLSTPTLIMNLTDRLWNETVYQTEKRGYEIRFRQEEGNDGFDKMVIKYSTVPKHKKPFIKVLILLNTILTPAWNFRDGYEWDERMLEEDN